ncbi:hypothetical protein ACP4OV_016955 [Aristida adscensionis]
MLHLNNVSYFYVLIKGKAEASNLYVVNKIGSLHYADGGLSTQAIRLNLTLLWFLYISRCWSFRVASSIKLLKTQLIATISFSGADIMLIQALEDLFCECMAGIELYTIFLAFYNTRPARERRLIANASS